MTALVTGGCGFIGSAVVRRLITQGVRVVNIDKLAGTAMPEALADLSTDRYRLVVGDVRDTGLLDKLFEAHRPRFVVHCAAETRSSNSVAEPAPFFAANVTGTYSLLEAARSYCSGNRVGTFRLLHVSTSEVYGSLDRVDAPHDEGDAYAPETPYAATKAAADHLVRAWGQSYALPVQTMNCSNIYGPWQFPDRLIPLMILNALEERQMPIHGTGRALRDWLHVDDLADAVWTVLRKGGPGEIFNVAGNAELENIEVVRRICDRVDERFPGSGDRRRLIHHLPEREACATRHAVDAGRIRRELGWRPSRSFDRGLSQTVDWYIENTVWWRRIRNAGEQKVDGSAKKEHALV